MSRNTVRKYLKESEPRRREGARARPVLEAVGSRIDALLAEWSPRTTPKQRITGSRVHQQLVESTQNLLFRSYFIVTNLEKAAAKPA